MLHKMLWSSSLTYLPVDLEFLSKLAGTPPLLEEGEPDIGVASYLGYDPVKDGGGFSAPRQYSEFIIKPGEVEFSHDAVVALLDQKLVAFRGKLFADELELGFGKREPIDIILPRAERIWQHDLGGDLLQN